jgi:adenine-specific DNA methylase
MALDVVVFAHKTTEGWEALLSGMVRGGWVITGSWPITTEMPNRLRARESAALAASVHLGRPRSKEAGTGDWTDVARELPKRISQAGNQGRRHALQCSTLPASASA